MPKVVKDAGLDVHVLGERVLVRYDVLLALGLLLALLPHPQVILVRTSTTTRVSLGSTSKVNSVSKLLSRKVQTRGRSLSLAVSHAGTPTKRQVSKHQVSKRLVSKRPVFKTSGLQNVRFTKRQVSKRLVSKRPVFKFDILIKQKVFVFVIFSYY